MANSPVPIKGHYRSYLSFLLLSRTYATAGELFHLNNFIYLNKSVQLLNQLRWIKNFLIWLAIGFRGKITRDGTDQNRHGKSNNNRPKSIKRRKIKEVDGSKIEKIVLN